MSTATTFDLLAWRQRWASVKRAWWWNEMADSSYDLAAQVKCEIAQRIMLAELAGAISVAGPVERAELEAAKRWALETPARLMGV